MGAAPVEDGHADAVLNRLAMSCLEDVDELVERFVPYVLATPGYSEGQVPEAVVSGTAVQVFELLLRGIGGVEVPQRLIDVSSQIGRDRAATGFGQVPGAVRLATTTARLLGDEHEGPLRTRDVWLKVAAVQLPDLAADLVLDVLGRLSVLDAGEAARIRETESTYMRGAGDAERDREHPLCASKHRHQSASAVRRADRTQRAPARGCSRGADGPRPRGRPGASPGRVSVATAAPARPDGHQRWSPLIGALAPRLSLSQDEVVTRDKQMST